MIGRCDKRHPATNSVAMLGLLDRDRGAPAENVRHQTTVVRIEVLDHQGSPPQNRQEGGAAPC